MSLDIPYAYRLASGDVTATHAVIGDARARALVAAQQHAARICGGWLANIMDFRAVLGSFDIQRTWDPTDGGDRFTTQHADPSVPAFPLVWIEFCERMRTTASTAFRDDINADVSAILWEIPHASGTLIALTAELAEIYAPVLAADARLGDFAYWDGSEDGPPQRVTAKAWRERRQVWRQVFASAHGYDDVGERHVLVDWQLLLLSPPSIDEVIAHVPSFETRVTQMARRLLESERMCSTIDAHRQSSTRDLFRVFSEARHEAQEWLAGLEGRTALAEREAVLRSLMNPEITPVTIGFDTAHPRPHDASHHAAHEHPLPRSSSPTTANVTAAATHDRPGRRA